MGDASSPPPTSRTGVYSPILMPIRILTHNIRFANDNPEEYECKWEDRFPHLSSHFKYHTREYFTPQSTLVCMQEVLHRQLQDLMRLTFNSPNSNPLTKESSQTSPEANDWAYLGVGRDDGKTQGEYSPIFYRQSAWRCLHFETVWLNETGEVGKKGWDASSVRILTCAVLESVLSPETASTTPKIILALNTHLDDQGDVSRREAAKLILEVSSRLRSQYSPAFTFLAGDLNSRPSGDAYRILNESGSGFVDTWSLISDDNNSEGKIYAYGNERTFTGFERDDRVEGKHRIDFVHLGITEGSHDDAGLDKTRQMVQAYGVLPSRFDDKVWMSDHRAVVVDLLVPFGEPSVCDTRHRMPLG
ncbi:uncharacterized protein Z518_07332 [Rhinocladiella mackenziei CBS 650.93]|uniref:Endonuclease/exonuclease/phosphatase domain-containing protein n=1 Tax=Rhinocladiella mackenziei CBS 650.93 TaxID=1442369 RepID=A0A0D2ID59_9EURO|nr:uncharacterized protein Z518_07332 [Rhinocladiella mackenziei CBS 650.93]KIX03779.1 hypothetical protein Z518_07332 [Rhinocladiella mackenziei CBS 650.93]